MWEPNHWYVLVENKRAYPFNLGDKDSASATAFLRQHGRKVHGPYTYRMLCATWPHLVRGWHKSERYKQTTQSVAQRRAAHTTKQTNKRRS